MSKPDNPKKYHNLASAENIEEEEKERIESLDGSQEQAELAGDLSSPDKAQKTAAPKKRPSARPLKRLLGYSKREWRLFSFGMIMLVGSLLIQFALPSFTGRVITALSEEKYGDINTICLELFIIVLVSVS